MREQLPSRLPKTVRWRCHAAGQQLVTDGDGLGFACRAGRQDHAAKIVFVDLRQQMRFKRAAVAFGPGQVRKDGAAHLRQRQRRARDQRVDLDREHDIALAQRQRDHAEPRQRQDNGRVKNHVLDVDGDDASLRQAKRVQLSDDVVNILLQASIADQADAGTRARRSRRPAAGAGIETGLDQRCSWPDNPFSY